jgi:SAM-dependent methyltransferase
MDGTRDASLSTTTESEQHRLKQIFQERFVGRPADRWSSCNRGNQWIHRERFEGTKRVLIRSGLWPLEELDILDIGCGGGGQLARLLSLGANPARLHGIDLIPQRIDRASADLPGVDIRVADARTFSLGPDSLDLVWLQTVLSSIRDDDIIFAIVDRIREMLRPGGGVLWYDFFLANPENLHTRPMRKRDIERYFRGFSIELTRVTVIPPLARRLGFMTDALYPVLRRIPVLCSHYLGLLGKP